MRKKSYAEAINEALHQMMDRNEKILIMGQGITSPWYVGKTTTGLLDRFQDRVIDSPVSENCVTGAAIGAALAGMHPIVVHPRMDFMHYAMDQIANHAANWHYMFGGQINVSVTLWGIVNRGGEQGAQHSQALQAIFCHLPGLKVVMPSTPYDAKGLLVACLEEDGPVIFIDDRWLYEIEGEVPQELYSIPIGKGAVRKGGSDLTIVAASYMAQESVKAAEILMKEGIDAEVIDLRSLKPLDKDLLYSSVRKTKRLIVVDSGWKTCGIAAEISACIAESAIFNSLKQPILRISLPDTPAPAGSVLEDIYYRKAKDIISGAKLIMAD